MNGTPTDNSNYTDGFPVGDDDKKREDTTSKDPSRPFDSARPKTDQQKKCDEEEFNSTGSTINGYGKDRFKK